MFQNIGFVDKKLKGRLTQQYSMILNGYLQTKEQLLTKTSPMMTYQHVTLNFI